MNLLPLRITLWLVAVGSALLTTYGMQAVHHTGSCGCGGDKKGGPQNAEAVLGRNMFLLGLLVFGLWFGPRTTEAQLTPAPLETAAVAPAAFMLLCALANVGRRIGQ